MSNSGFTKTSARRHCSHLSDAVDNLKACLEEANLGEARQFKKGDFVKGSAETALYTVTVRGYFAGDHTLPEWGLMMIKQDGKWRLVSAYDLEPAGKGNAKDRMAAMRAFDAWRRRKKRAAERAKAAQAAHEKAVRETDWDGLMARALEVAKLLKRVEDSVPRRFYAAKRRQLVNIGRDLQAKRKPTRDWIGYLDDIERQIKREAGIKG